MAMSGYLEEPFDLCEGLFDNIEDILDFSNSDNVLMGMVDSCVDGGQQLAPPPPPPFSAPAFPCSSEKDSSGLTVVSEEVGKICDELNITEDWLSNFLDDTDFNLDLPAPAAISAPNDADRALIKDDSLFRSASPVSVLEPCNLGGGGGGTESGMSISSSSSSNYINNNDIDVVSLRAVSTPRGPVAALIPARARTKRPRPATLSQCIAVPILEPKRDVAVPAKKKKARVTASEELAGARKCMHCGIQKTPQWRAGPMGPKTLCNACGVRYKSGRLFPEYRPAASPTFVPSIHSNSHKKVVEMRIKATAKDPNPNTTTKVSTAAKNCDLLLYIKRKE